MGACVVGETIYISKDLAEKLTGRERRVVLAHELGHYEHRHTLVNALWTILFFWWPSLVNRKRRHMEMIADRYALELTNDKQAFISLMDKLEHSGPSHPTKVERINLAANWGEPCPA